MPPFQILFICGYKKQLEGVRWASRELGWLNTTTILFLAKNAGRSRLCGQGHCHGGRTNPHPATFLDVFLQTVTQLIQLIQAKLLIYCVSWRIKLPLHYPINIFFGEEGGVVLGKFGDFH